MDDAFVLCRLLHYGSAMLLFGAGLFSRALAPTALALDLAAAQRRLLGWASALAVATALAWLFLAAGQMGEGWSDAWSPGTWSTVLFDTAFGRVWQIHLLLGLALVLVRAISRDGARMHGTAAVSALFLGSLGFVGHAAMRSGEWGWINRASHVAHLLAAGFWLGSLAPLMACLARLDRPDLRPSISVTLRRFSALGHGAVGVVLITGVVNTALVLGRWPVDPAAPYQALLLAKIGVVVVMVGIALFNRYGLVPKLGGSEGEGALRRLRIMTIGEIILGFAALGLVSLLGTLSPN